jgi:hypothetical protein
VSMIMAEVATGRGGGRQARHITHTGGSPMFPAGLSHDRTCHPIREEEVDGVSQRSAGRRAP